MARVLMKGCEAIAEAAVRAGCRFFAGYPITPQNEIPEYFARRLPEVGGNFVQGESEVASINMVYGSASVGARSMTSSSISVFPPALSLSSIARSVRISLFMIILLIFDFTVAIISLFIRKFICRPHD